MQRQNLPRLVLHFDVNETILLGDVAGGDTFEESINKSLAKNAIVNISDENNVTWYDGTPLEVSNGVHPPPLLPDWERPKNCTSYYEHYRSLLGDERKKFTTLKHGRGYRDIYEKVEKKLRWPDAVEKPDASHCILHKDGTHQFLLPSFFKTLVELKKQNRHFSVVIRTYGDDMDELVACINAFSQGKHLPKYYPNHSNDSDLSEFYIAKENVWRGRYDENDGMFKLQNKYNRKQILFVRPGMVEYIYWYIYSSSQKKKTKIS